MSVKLEYDRNDPAWLHEPNYMDIDEITDDDFMADQEEPEEGVPFFAEGNDYVWLEPESDVYHMDFDNWQVWSATDGVGTDYFVVDIDTGFIDWGPCSEKEAKDFLESKYQDYLDESDKPENTDNIVNESSYDGSYGEGSIEYPVFMNSAEVGMNDDDFDAIAYIHADSEDEANDLLNKYFPSTRGTKYYLGNPNDDAFGEDDIYDEVELDEDTVKKSNGKWTNRGDDGKEHGEFATKKAADAQRKAMFANGYKAEDTDIIDIDDSHLSDEEYNIKMIMWYFGVGYKDAKDGIESGYYTDKDIEKSKDYWNKKHNPYYDESKNITEKNFYVDVKDNTDTYYDSFWVNCDRINQCQREVNNMIGSNYKVSAIYDEDDNLLWPKRRMEAKADKEYTVIIHRRGKDKEVTGTLDYLKTYFGYTLQKGSDYQNERGNKKINKNPTTIKSLITNINNAESNAAANGSSDTSYELKECTNPGSIPNAPAKHIRIMQDLDKKDESKTTGILMANVGDEVVDSRTGKIGIVKGTTGSRSNETTYIVDFDGKEKRINAMRDAQTSGRYYLKKDESIITEIEDSRRMDRDTKAFYDKICELNKYTGIVMRQIKEKDIVDPLLRVSYIKISGIVDAMEVIVNNLD